jgi:hypothetical protein
MGVLRQAAQTALDAYDQHDPLGVVMADLRAALAQPDESFCDSHCTWHDHHPDCTLAQPERKPLREEDIELAYREIWRDLSDGFSHTSAEWIEAGIRYAEKVHGIE